jgi:omega-6 fatty acid desaturase (delta-12 desaturase)
MTQDQVFVPKTRSELKLPPLDPAREDITGEHVSKEAMAEMWEALGDSPISATIVAALQLVGLQSGANRFRADGLAL